MSGAKLPDSIVIGRGLLKSGADLSTHTGKIVKKSGANAVLATADTGFGVLSDGGSASGDNVTVVMGHCMVKCNEVMAVDDKFTSDANGLAIIADTALQVPLGRVLSVNVAQTGWAEVFFAGEADEAI